MKSNTSCKTSLIYLKNKSYSIRTYLFIRRFPLDQSLDVELRGVPHVHVAVGLQELPAYIADILDAVKK